MFSDHHDCWTAWGWQDNMVSADPKGQSSHEIQHHWYRYSDREDESEWFAKEEKLPWALGCSHTESHELSE